MQTVTSGYARFAELSQIPNSEETPARLTAIYHESESGVFKLSSSALWIWDDLWRPPTIGLFGNRCAIERDRNVENHDIPIILKGLQLS